MFSDMAGRAVLRRHRSATRQAASTALTYPAVAFPLNPAYLAGRNVDFERAEATDAGFPSLQ